MLSKCTHPPPYSHTNWSALLCSGVSECLCVCYLYLTDWSSILITSTFRSSALASLGSAMSFFHTFIVYISSALPSSPACWFLFYFGVHCLIVAAISLPSSQCGRTILSISWTGSVLTVPYHTSFLAFACCSQLFAGQSFLFFPFSFCFVSSLFLFSINSHCYNPCYLQQRTAYLLSATCSVGHFPAKKKKNTD